MENNQETHQPQPAHEDSGAKAAGNRTIMGILAYLGVLVIVPFLMAKDDPFVKFHIKQGLVLLVGWAILWVAGMFMYMLWPLIQVVNLGILVLAIIGIVNVVQGHKKELPLVGQFAENFKF